MNRIVVLYATREGHTAKIAQRIATDLRIRGFEAEEYDLRSSWLDPDLQGYGGAILAGSVHLGRHEPELVQFVKNNRQQLEGMPTAFVSVTLSEAEADVADKASEERREFAAAVEKVTDAFVEETGWHPSHINPLAGAIRYTHSGILVRLIIRTMTKRVGAPLDTAGDYVFTDWLDLDHFTEEIADEMAGSCAAPPVIPPTALAGS